MTAQSSSAEGSVRHGLAQALASDASNTSLRAAAAESDRDSNAFPADSPLSSICPAAVAARGSAVADSGTVEPRETQPEATRQHTAATRSTVECNVVEAVFQGRPLLRGPIYNRSGAAVVVDDDLPQEAQLLLSRNEAAGHGNASLRSSRNSNTSSSSISSSSSSSASNAAAINNAQTATVATGNNGGSSVIVVKTQYSDGEKGATGVPVPVRRPFLEEVPDDLKCPICFDSAVSCQTSCSHFFCFACINSHINNRLRQQQTVNCPICRTTVSANRLMGIGAEKLVRVRALRVACLGAVSGCFLSGTLQQMEAHEYFCQHVLVFCRFRQRGCITPLVRGEASQHESRCRFNPNVRSCCYYLSGCKVRGTEDLLQPHEPRCRYRNMEKFVRCPHFHAAGCKLLVKKKFRDRHAEFCPFQLVKQAARVSLQHSNNSDSSRQIGDCDESRPPGQIRTRGIDGCSGGALSERPLQISLPCGDSFEACRATAFSNTSNVSAAAAVVPAKSADDPKVLHSSHPAMKSADNLMRDLDVLSTFQQDQRKHKRSTESAAGEMQQQSSERHVKRRQREVGAAEQDIDNSADIPPNICSASSSSRCVGAAAHSDVASDSCCENICEQDVDSKNTSNADRDNFANQQRPGGREAENRSGVEVSQQPNGSSNGSEAELFSFRVSFEWRDSEKRKPSYEELRTLLSAYLPNVVNVADGRTFGEFHAILENIPVLALRGVGIAADPHMSCSLELLNLRLKGITAAIAGID